MALVSCDWCGLKYDSAKGTLIGDYCSEKCKKEYKETQEQKEEIRKQKREKSDQILNNTFQASKEFKNFAKESAKKSEEMFNKFLLKDNAKFHIWFFVLCGWYLGSFMLVLSIPLFHIRYKSIRHLILRLFGKW